MFSSIPTLFASTTSFLNPEHLIETFGTIGIIAIIFAESFFAFFLPGDSLLFTAGILSAEHKFGLNFWVIAIGTTLGAIAGNQIGYAIGRKMGPPLFERPNSRIFKKSHLEKTQAYFEHYGPKTILLARFVPVVRTFACVIAGVAKMEYKVFLTYNVIGAVLWGAGVTALGWITAKTLGHAIDVDKYLLPIVAIVIGLSFIPVIWEYSRSKKHISEKMAASGQANKVIEEEVSED